MQTKYLHYSAFKFKQKAERLYIYYFPSFKAKSYLTDTPVHIQYIPYHSVIHIILMFANSIYKLIKYIWVSVGTGSETMRLSSLYQSFTALWAVFFFFSRNVWGSLVADQKQWQKNVFPLPPLAATRYWQPGWPSS